MVFRCFVRKKKAFDVAGPALARELREVLGLKGLTDLCVFRRYDVEGVDRAVYDRAKTIVFAEPQVDELFEETLEAKGVRVLGVESLPGQFDQRADSAGQCLQMLAGGERPMVRCADIYWLFGDLSEADMEKAKKHLINPVECREASLDKPATLVQSYSEAADVKTVDGFTAMDQGGLKALLEDMGLAMDLDDLRFLQSYFRDQEIGRAHV